MRSCSRASAAGSGRAACSSPRWVSATSPGDVEADWLGVEMYFSHFGAKANRRLVERAGLVIDRAEVAAEPEDRHDARFLWVVARAPAGA